MWFPLSEDCSTVGAPSLPQRKAAEEPKRKQDDGQEDAQAGEAVFQDTNPADRAASDHDDGVGRIPVSRKEELRGRPAHVPINREDIQDKNEEPMNVHLGAHITNSHQRSQDVARQEIEVPHRGEPQIFVLEDDHSCLQP